MTIVGGVLCDQALKAQVADCVTMPALETYIKMPEKSGITLLGPHLPLEIFSFPPTVTSCGDNGVITPVVKYIFWNSQRYVSIPLSRRCTHFRGGGQHST